MKAIGIFTGRAKFDLELQIVVHELTDAKAEVKDLKKNYGCDDARFREFEDETALYAWYEKNR